jgi:hypothetical protein
MYDRYATAYNMWKGFSHWSSFMMLRHELLGMHITLSGFLVLIYYPNLKLGFSFWFFTLSGFLVLPQYRVRGSEDKSKFYSTFAYLVMLTMTIRNHLWVR